MKQNILRAMLFSVMILCTGCNKEPQAEIPQGDPRDNTPLVLETVASEEITYGSDIFYLDASHTSDGYVMAKYCGNN